MDQGIIKNLKTFYRKELVQITIAAIEDSVVSTSCIAIKLGSKVSILEAIHLLVKSWRQVNSKTIVNCFRKEGFVKPLPEDSRLSQEPGVDGNKEDDTLSLPEVVNGAEYLNIDDHALSFSEDNHEDYIIEAIVNKRACADGNDDSEDDSDQEQTVEPTVMHTAARREALERYFMEQGFSETLTAALDTCFVRMQ